MSKYYISGLVSLLLLSFSGQALAFTVLKAPNGQPLRWESHIIPFFIGPLSDDASEEAQIDAILESAYTWEEASNGRLSLEFMGFTDIDYEKREDENVVFMVKDNWGFSGSAVAITRTWALGSGEIEGFDIHLNDTISTFAAEDIPPPGTTDLQNTVTHEFGHVLGLDHSNDPHACMFSTAVRGEITKRDLNEDDIAGLQWLYSAGPYTQGWQCNSAPSAAPPLGSLLLLMTLFLRRRKS